MMKISNNLAGSHHNWCSEEKKPFGKMPFRNKNRSDKKKTRQNIVLSSVLQRMRIPTRKDVSVWRLFLECVQNIPRIPILRLLMLITVFAEYMAYGTRNSWCTFKTSELCAWYTGDRNNQKLPVHFGALIISVKCTIELTSLVKEWSWHGIIWNSNNAHDYTILYISDQRFAQIESSLVFRRRIWYYSVRGK